MVAVLAVDTDLVTDLVTVLGMETGTGQVMVPVTAGEGDILRAMVTATVTATGMNTAAAEAAQGIADSRNDFGSP
jgi:hypothetical protein